MPTQITQIEDDERGRTILRIEGTLTREDALILEKIATEISEFGTGVTIDIADLLFLDTESAPILKRLEERGFEITGMEIFLQAAVDEAERR